MQKCNVSRYAVGLCFCLVRLNFTAPSVYRFKLQVTANLYLDTMRYYLSMTGNSRVSLRHGHDFESLILNGHEFVPERAQTLLDLGDFTQPSAAQRDSVKSHLAAFGVKR